MATRRVAKQPAPNRRKKPAAKKAPKKRGKKKSTAPTIPKNEAIYETFIEYMALPSVVRPQVYNHPKTNEPIESQRQFADAYGVHESRISEWKRSDDYHEKVSRARRRYFKGEIGDAIHAVLLNVIQNGKGADLKVLLEYAKEIERDDPLGETTAEFNEILRKINKMIPD